MLPALFLAGCTPDQEIMAGGGYACLLTEGRIECQSNADQGDMGETSPPD